MGLKNKAERTVQRHPRRWYWIAYTVLFLFLFSVIAGGYLLFGKSFVFEGRMGDGLRQHYVSLAYYGQYLRQILSNIFVEHRLELPMWDLHMGYGSDILTTLHYYAMGDPLNLLSVLVPMKYTEYLYDFLLVLRMYLAGWAFSLYCLYHKNKRFPTLMGALLFAFCQWILVAGFKHPFFINPCIYFPLLLLGADKIFDKKKPYLYIIVIAVSAVSNFYFFYMLGIFVVIYAVFRYFMLFKKVRAKELVGWLGRFAGYSLIGMLLSAVVFLPSLLAVLGTNRVGADNYIPTFYRTKYYHMLLPALMGKFQSYYTLIGVSAVGVLGLFLLFVKWKRNMELKIGFIMCMLFLMVPFMGHVFNGFSYSTNRWSWVLAMLVCYIFVKTYPSLSALSKDERRGLMAGVFCLIVFICLDTYARNQWNILAAAVFAGVTAVLLLGYGYFKRHRAVTGAFVLAGICLGTVLNFYFCFTSAGNSQSGIWKFADAGSAYEKNTGIVPKKLKDLPDIGEYRYEQEGAGVLQNSTMLTGLNGGQFFFSLANGNVSRFLDEMYSNRPYEQIYKDVNGRSYLMKLLSMKYFVGPEQYVPYGFEKIDKFKIKTADLLKEEQLDLGVDEDNEKEEKKKAKGQKEKISIGIYEDSQALPMAYTYDTYIPREEYDKMGVMEKQQALLQGVVLEESGLPQCSVSDTSEERPYTIIPGKGCKLYKNRIKAKKDGASCVIEFEGLPESEVYVAFDNLQYLEVNRRHTYTDEEWKKLPARKRREITLKDEQVQNQAEIQMEAEADGKVVQRKIQTVTNKNNFYSGRSNFMNQMGYCEKPITRIKLTFSDKGSYQYDDLSIYFQPVDNLEGYARERRADSVENLTIHGNQASCQVSLDAPKALVFSLPYGEGWSARVDGQEAELKQANTMFMALELEPGNHEIELYYVTPYMKLGLLLSITGVVLLCVVIIVDKKKKRNTV